MLAILQNFFRSSFYNYGILLIILFNSIALGAATSPSVKADYGDLLVIIDDVCMGIFIVENLLKLIAFRLSFFTSKERFWNIFDLLVVALSIYTSMHTSAFRAFRAIRLLRTLSLLPSMRLICSSLFFAIPQVMSILALLMLFYYVYAVILTNIFAEKLPEFFGNMGISFYSLFMIMTFDNGSDIIREAVKIAPSAWPIFISFIIICTFVVMNLIVAIIVNHISEYKTAMHKLERAKQREARRNETASTKEK